MGARFLISSQTLTSSAATVTFSSIPATYTDLVLRVSSRSDRSASAFEEITMVINGDTASNYSTTYMQGDGTTATSVRTTSATDARLKFSSEGVSATANTFASVDIYIPSYTASQNKPFGLFSAQENNTTAAYLLGTALLWRNTAAITSISLSTVFAANFVTGSSFYLYGISKTN